MSLRTFPLIIHPAYLRFVEAGKNDSFLDQLNPKDVSAKVPDLKKRYDIADFISVDPMMIRSMVRNKEKHYRVFDISKKSGGTRQISAPRTFLKVVQWWILDTILEKVQINDSATGFVKGCSFITNARRHLGSKHILNVDLKNFFPSIGYLSVYQIFLRLGYSGDVADVLAELCTLDGELPQGAPTSPALSNILLRQVDEQMVQLSNLFGIKTYSRYADDLTFSSSQKIPIEVISNMRDILSNVDLRINDKKTHFMGPNQTKEVTGLILGRDDVALPKRYLNSARGWFHSIRTNPSAYSGKQARVSGTLQLIKQVGGRGSTKVINGGEMALQALKYAQPPVLRWDDE